MISTSIPSSTKVEFVGRVFKLPKESCLFSYTVQKEVILRNDTLFKVTGRAGAGQYFCEEVYFTKNKEVKSVCVLFHEDIIPCYAAYFSDIEKAEEIIL